MTEARSNTDHQSIQATTRDIRQWLPLVGRYVEIHWTDNLGPQSAEGGLVSFDSDGSGRTWAVLDWGYGVDVDARDFEIKDYERG